VRQLFPYTVQLYTLLAASGLRDTLQRGQVSALGRQFRDRLRGVL